MVARGHHEDDTADAPGFGAIATFQREAISKLLDRRRHVTDDVPDPDDRDLVAFEPLQDRLGATRIRRMRQRLGDPTAFGGDCGHQTMAA